MEEYWNSEGLYTGPLNHWGDVPHEFQRSPKRVFSIGPTDDRPPGLSLELVHAMARDLNKYPSLRMLATAYRIDYATVEGWILKGISGGASELESMLSVMLAEAEAEAAREVYALFQLSASVGSKSAGDYYKLLTERWGHISTDPDISTLVQRRSDKGARRSNLLKNPPPALVAELNAAGWVRRDE
jgi:hypothetical protein